MIDRDDIEKKENLQEGQEILNRECYVTISFDLSQVSLDDVFEAQEALGKLGVSFDTGSGCGERDWSFDWSLKGPVKVRFRGLKKTLSAPSQSEKSI